MISKKKLLLPSMLFAIGSLAAFSGHTEEDQVPLIGLDGDGQPVEVFLEKSDYTKRLYESLGAIHDSALSTLSRRKEEGSWALRTVVVGVGAGAEVGLGPLIKLKAIPRFRVTFSNSKDPALP